MSYGQTICGEFLRAIVNEPFLENYRPKWLFGMELDFLFEEAGVAIEFNGDQHYFQTTLAADPIPQMRRDKAKKRICREKGIQLLTVEACHLTRSKIRCMLKKTRLVLLPSSNLPILEDKAASYRNLLINRYNSPTSRRKGSAARKAAKESRNPNNPQLHDDNTTTH